MKNDLRVTLTKRMLKDGLLKTLTCKTLSKITVTDLCKEADVNRATFYNHYDSPAMVLKEIAEDYADKLFDLYHTVKREKMDKDAAVEACLTYLYERKDEIRILFSENAEHSINGLGLDIIKTNLADKREILPGNISGSREDAFLYSVITASASFGLIQAWLTMDIDKTPHEILTLLKNTFGENYFS